MAKRAPTTTATDVVVEPFALDEVAPKKKGKGPFPFTWDGETYTCIDLDALDVRRVGKQIRELDDYDDANAMLLWLLGEEQYERLDQSEVAFQPHHFQALMDAWSKHHGVSLPKSSGSRTSSRTIR